MSDQDNVEDSNSPQGPSDMESDGPMSSKNESGVNSKDDEPSQINTTQDETDINSEEKREVKFQYAEDQYVSPLDLRECVEYIDVVSRASHFVDELINEAEDEICQGPFEDRRDGERLKKRYLKQTYGYMTWPNRQDLDVAAGAEVIDKYIQSFFFKENWLYCIDYLGEISDPCKDYYKYEVKFSIPCDPYPVPQATASAYFIIESSRIKPENCPVDVYYQMEGNRSQFIPWKQEFREEWLFHIVDAKLKLFKTLTF